MHGLTGLAALQDVPSAIVARAYAALDGRLLRDDPRPVAVGVSGGGDSMALLAIACDWGRLRGRPVLALSVDHGLQPQGRAWSEQALAQAARMGAKTRLLTWTGDKPVHGLPAAAREARHRLLAQAAREAGARVVLLAHTADDVAEADWMRARGTPLGEMAEWSPSPAWPEGRGVFLLRPLLAEGRTELRAFLRGRGIEWIEDPANDDQRFLRSQARLSLPPRRGKGGNAGARLEAPAPPPSTQTVLLPASTPTPAPSRGRGDWFEFARADLTDRRLVAAALLCAAGTSRPPRSERLDALLARLTGTAPFTTTLAGARVVAGAETVLICREAGERARGGLPLLGLEPGSVSVWDGRWEIRVERPGLAVGPLAGRMATLFPADRRYVLGLPAPVRPTLPVILDAGDDPKGRRPVLAWTVAEASALAPARLAAACGQIAHERAISSHVNGAGSPARLC